MKSKTLGEAPFLQEEEPNMPTDISPKKAKTLTRTLIPNLVHHVRLENTEINCYLCNRDGVLQIEETAVVDEKLCQPKQDLPFICLSPKILKTEPVDPVEVLKRTEEYLKSFIEFPHDQQYLIASLYIGHTYFLDEHFDVTPILNVFGVKETGKTKFGEILALTTYRGERCTSPTEATLFRAAQAFKSTLIIDEIRLWGKNGRADVADLIKSRYKRGLTVSRINMNRAGEDAIEYYDVFAPLVICSTEAVPEIIKTRCITFVMQQNSEPAVEKKPDPKEAEWLREQWTLLRFAWMGRDLPEVENKARRRLKEITNPLLQVCQLTDPSRLDEVVDFISYIDLIKTETEGVSTEAEIVRKVWECKDLAIGGKILTSDITEAMNRGKSEKDHFSDKYIAACINRLGFEKTQITSRRNRRGFLHDVELLDKLMKKYNLEKDDESGTTFREEEGENFFDETISPIKV